MAEDNVECVIDMVDKSVNVEFSNHKFNGELQDVAAEEVSEETNSDMPVAKMRVLEWQTEEETQAMVEETCSNMWWNWVDGGCVLEDGSIVNF